MKFKKTNKIRFDKILETGNFNNKKVHNVGCGLAHFYEFLKNKKINFTYIWSNISKEMIHSAENNHLNKNINL